jgi:hypothetical protein
MENSTLRGSCLCGAIQYEFAAPLEIIEHCHCSMCRKAHGAAFSTNAVVRTKALIVRSGERLISQYQSSPNRLKCFCSNCGSQLFIRRLDKPDVTVITLGTMDGDLHTRPERHVFVASKAPWYDIADALPQFEIYSGHESTEDAIST